MKEYKITKLINNNVVFAEDLGQEIILFGKAIGFGKKRDDVVKEEQVIKIFRSATDSEKNYLSNLVEDIDVTYIDLASQIIAMFEQEMNVKVNDMMLVSLSDHISNAVINEKEGVHVPLDILEQVIGLYPKEYKIAKKGLDLIEQETGVALQKSEAGFIVLHYINNRGSSSRSDGKYQILFQEKIIKDVEEYFHVQLDRESLYFIRFMTHLSFLAVRLHDKSALKEGDSMVYEALISKYPKLKGCIEKNEKTIQEAFNENISDEEKGYLAIHINNMLRTLGKENK